MSLCGATGCGCAVAGKPLSAPLGSLGAVGGEYPTISIGGSGEPGYPFVPMFNTAWADAITAARLAQAAAQTEWLPFTPVVSQSAVVTKSIEYSEYTRSGFNGTTIKWNFSMTITSSGTPGNGIQITTPVAGLNTNQSIGTVFLYIATPGPNQFICEVLAVNTNAVALYTTGAVGSTGQAGIAPAGTDLVNGSAIRGSVVYRVP